MPKSPESATATTLSRADREMLQAWLVGADFPMAPIVRRLIAASDRHERALRRINEYDMTSPGPPIIQMQEIARKALRNADG